MRIQETDAKRVQDQAQLVGKGDPQGIVQEIEIRPHYQMVCAQNKIRTERHKILWDFEIQADHLISVKRQYLELMVWFLCLMAYQLFLGF